MDPTTLLRDHPRAVPEAISVAPPARGGGTRTRAARYVAYSDAAPAERTTWLPGRWWCAGALKVAA